MQLIVDQWHDLYHTIDAYFVEIWGAMGYPDDFCKICKEWVMDEFGLDIECTESPDLRWSSYTFQSEDDLLKFMVLYESNN